MRPSGIEFDRVWKKFHRGEVNDSLRDLIPALGKRLIGAAPRRDQLASGDFWALQDVSFQVAPGEVLGIIGANGAGKSTALKVLTNILRPNRGRCVVHGRIGALIEVAAGFHPDLTGRENVFLQGAIMGMPVPEIREKFDEIVDFSGVADAIDTPVKRYSNGMNARLGFAIAAHLDPDVLIIDEVLSVGDFAFQDRAFGRVRTLARSGIPVVVVSHQLDRVVELCTSAILLERGRVVQRGDPKECVAAYVSGEASSAVAETDPDCPIRIDSVAIEGSEEVSSGDRVCLHIAGRARGPAPDHLEPVGVRVRALHTGEVVFATSTSRLKVELPSHGPFGLQLEIQLNVPEGNYVVETVTWDRRHNREAGTGPVARIAVAKGVSFDGPVQMNPTMRSVATSAATAGSTPLPVSALGARG